MGLVKDLCHKREVVSTEAVGGAPLLVLLIETANGDVEAKPDRSLSRPNCGLDSSKSDAVSWFVLSRHFRFSLFAERSISLTKTGGMGIAARRNSQREP